MSNRKDFEQQTDPLIAVVDDICDVEETEKPFGKRWHHEGIVLRGEHLAALREGKAVAVDVREEYVVLLKPNDKVAVRMKEFGYAQSKGASAADVK